MFVSRMGCPNATGMTKFPSVLECICDELGFELANQLSSVQGVLMFLKTDRCCQFDLAFTERI